MLAARVEFRGMKDVLNTYTILEHRAVPTLRHATFGDLKRVEERAKMKAPVSKGGGDLRDSIHVEKTTEGAIIVAGGSKAPYAVFQELGFREHIIPMSYIKGGQDMGFAMVSKHTPFIGPSVTHIFGVSPHFRRLKEIQTRRLNRLLSRSR